MNSVSVFYCLKCYWINYPCSLMSNCLVVHRYQWCHLNWGGGFGGESWWLDNIEYYWGLTNIESLAQYLSLICRNVNNSHGTSNVHNQQNNSKHCYAFIRESVSSRFFPWTDGVNIIIKSNVELQYTVFIVGNVWGLLAALASQVPADKWCGYSHLHIYHVHQKELSLERKVHFVNCFLK